MLVFHEITYAGWFILSLILACMFTHICYRTWRDLGYGAIETKAAVALTVYFWASALARMWAWLILWAPQHGYPTLGAELFVMVWWPIGANLIGVAGALCAVRIFYPWWTRRGSMVNLMTTWLVPLVIALAFVFVTLIW